MTAQTLRDAAKVLRERAEAATPGPWSTIPGASNVWRFPDEGRPTVIAAGNGSQGHHIRHDDADYIATTHPGVGLALADWLDYFGDLLAKAEELDMVEERPFANALTVARAILGGDA